MAEEKIFKSIEVEELMERINDKDSFILIDTLTGIHFEKVHLPGARSAFTGLPAAALLLNTWKPLAAARSVISTAASS